MPDPVTFAIGAGTAIVLCWWALDEARRIVRNRKALRRARRRPGYIHRNPGRNYGTRHDGGRL